MSNKKKMQKCYLYTRVSTQVQAVDGYSLDAQHNRLLQTAEYHQLAVVREFSDKGISGKNTTDRPQITEMLRLIENGNPDGVRYVLVFKLSRFARNAADVLCSLQAMQDSGVDLISADEGIDSSGSAGKLVISVLAAVAEIERENIRAQVIAGQEQKAKEGGWNGGQTPFGYKLVRDENGKNGRLVVDEEEAEIVRLIFDKYVHTGMGYSGVAKWLNANGYIREVRQHGKYSVFTGPAVSTILENPVYTGKIVYGRFAMEKVKGTRNKTRSVKHDKYDTYDGQHEAIIPEELWQAAQTKRKSAAGKVPDHHGPKHTHVLSGLLRCPECGAPMYGTVNRPKKKDGSGHYPGIHYYVCKNAKEATGTRCSFTRNLRADVLDEQVLEVVQMALDNMDFTEQVRDVYGRKENLDGLTKRLDKLQKEKEKQERNKAKLLDNIFKLDSDDELYHAMYKDLQGVLRQIEESITVLDGQIEEINIRIYHAREGSMSQERALQIVNEKVRNVGAWPADDKREVMHEVLESVEIRPEPTLGGSYVKRVRFKFPVSLDGVTYGNYVDITDADDDDTPPDDDPPSGGGTPPRAPTSGEGELPLRDSPSSGDISQGDSFTPNENSTMPLLVRVPVTSKPRFLRYMTRLVGTLTPLNGVVTKITLEKATSKAGKPYALFNFEAVSVLGPEEAAHAKAFAEQFMEIVDAADMEPDMSEAS